MNPLHVTIDNRLRLPANTPPGMITRLRSRTTHQNPDYLKKRRMGFWVGEIPSRIATWRLDGSHFSLPRGATSHVREVARELGMAVRWIDNRVVKPVDWEPCRVPARDYQESGIQICLKTEQGIVQSPTGSGKTFMALASLPRFGQRALVVMRDRNLLDQWLMRAESDLGLRAKDIGIIQGARRTIGERLTLALQQTLYSKTFPLEDFTQHFGVLFVDEVHDAAAKTVNETVDCFPARVRIGFSADHTRKDRKEFLIEDQFGPVIYKVGKDQLERKGAVCPVVVRLVPTQFEADWYFKAPPEERDFTRLVTEMLDNEPRCELVRFVIQELVQAGIIPALVFTHRREHAMRLAERELPADGIPAGLLLGSEGNADQFEESKALLLKGVLKVAVGTFKSIGQGIDIPNVMAGVCATPISRNPQFFGQVRGRICRPVPGKRVGYLYYLWDSKVFPDAAKNLLKWNDGSVEVYDRDRQGWVSFR